MRQVTAPLLLTLAFLALVGCGEPHDSGEVDAPPDPTGEWQLTSMLGQGLPQGARISLTLDAQGKAAGFGGCNRYFGTFETGITGTISFGSLASTRMACSEPLMEAERRYLEALETVASFRVPAGGLELLDAAGETALSFTGTGASSE